MTKAAVDKIIIRRGSKMRLSELLTEREFQVLKLIVCGDSTKSVASQLGISGKTVETHRTHIHAKLRALTGNSFPMIKLVHMAIQSGVIPHLEFSFLIKEDELAKKGVRPTLCK
jgi:DNA-binding NarL/FixJ family response regulator